MRQFWTKSRSLLHIIALEWLRDDQALWSFIGEAMRQWERVYEAFSTHRRSVVLHQLASRFGHDWPLMLKELQSRGVISKAKEDNPSAISKQQNASLMSLRKLASRECSDAIASRTRARAFGFGVT